MSVNPSHPSGRTADTGYLEIPEHREAWDRYIRSDYSDPQVAYQQKLAALRTMRDIQTEYFAARGLDLHGRPLH